MARSALLLLAVAVLALPLGALADWDPTQPAKWVQYPDLSTLGIDVNASNNFILADDFMCTQSGPITGIHIWGSWLNDFVADARFTLSIHADIPAEQSPTGYSMPGEVLWVRYFLPGEYVVRTWVEGIDEGWMDPPDYYIFPADHICFQYNFSILEIEAFHQQAGTIYWLDVKAEPIEPGALFGWKTSQHHWNDDAVWGWGIEPYYGPWNELRYPLNHELSGQSIDLAFVLTAPAVTELDWGDAPDPGYPTLAASNGANHVIGGPWLGDFTDMPDADPDGQPDPLAKGDDVTGSDDEDGIQIPPLVLGKTATILYEVNGVPGCVDGWIDFNGDQIWQDPAERVLATPLLPPGVYAVSVPVPATAIVGQTFARFRVSTSGSLAPRGGAMDGEVEDYQVTILEPHKWLQAPDLSPTGTGIDVNATEPYILADDFLCTEQGRVVEIKVWGSWVNDYLPNGNPSAVDFALSFHSDMPIGPNGYSQPNVPEWWHYFTARDFTVMVWRDQIVEGWMDPPSQYIYPADTICWLYTFYVPAEEAFFQAGSEMEPIVYWLDVQAYPHDEDAVFGWKTSLDHWNDDAVWGQGFEPYPGPWFELRYPPGHQWEGVSIDLAFALRTDPTSGAPVKDTGGLWLYQNQPNPFGTSTTIAYEMPSAGGHVKLEVFDVSGRTVATLVDEVRPGGLGTVEWTGKDGGGRDVSSGVYFYRLTVGDSELTRKMMFLK